MTINLNDNPEKIYDLDPGEFVFVDNTRFEFCSGGVTSVRFYLSADAGNRIGYNTAHVRNIHFRALFTRAELFHLITTRGYYIL